MFLRLAVAVLVLAPSALAQHPSLFRPLDFAAGQEAAKVEGKFLLLDAMTSWCAPCKMMDPR